MKQLTVSSSRNISEGHVSVFHPNSLCQVVPRFIISLVILFLLFASHSKAQITAVPLTQTVCSNINTQVVVLTGPSGTITIPFIGIISWNTTFSWNNISGIGPLTTGNGNIPSFTYNNVSGIPAIIIFRVTPSYVFHLLIGDWTIPQTPFDVKVIINPAPVAPTVIPASYTACIGTTATLTASGASGSDIYRWYNAATGGTLLFTGNPYVTPPITLGTTNYYAALSNSYGCESTRQAVTITGTAAPIITAQPANSTICSTSPNTSFSITATGASPSYQWYENTGSGWNPITNGGVNPTYGGATSNNLSITNAPIIMNGYLYRCTISLSGCSVTSNAASLTIIGASSITTQPTAPLQVCSGYPVTFTAVATGQTFQWQYSSNNTVYSPVPNLAPYSGVNSPVLVISAATTALIPAGTAGWYRLAITSCGITIWTIPFRLNVVTTPSFTLQPSSTPPLCSGVTAIFSVTNNPTTVNRQWEVSIDNGGSWSIIPGATAATLNVITNPSMNLYQYHCIATVAATSCSATSTAAILTVNSPPIIVSPPQDLIVCNGGTANFSVSATGTAPLNYQWQKNGVAITGATSNTYTINPVGAGDVGNYTVVVTNSCGTVTSTPANLSLSPSIITLQPSDQLICTGVPVSFTVGVSSGNPSYQWAWSPDGTTWTNITNGGVYTGANSATLNISDATGLGGNQYICYVIGTCPEVTNAATLRVKNIEVDGAIAPPIRYYQTLQSAFAAINAGTHTGALITVKINCSTTETGTAVLNASGGTSSYTNILIYPTASGLSITGNLSSTPLIDLNGADNVTINGSLNGTGSAADLTISNTSTSSTLQTSTIRLQSDATNNTITYCNILGSSTTTTLAQRGGNIWIGASSPTTGNDNNTISNCNIGPAGTNLPTKCIYLSGTQVVGRENNGDIITNNNIYDFFSATVPSAGIYSENGNTGCSFTNNKFYQTAARTQTTGTRHLGIGIANGAGNGYIISGNTIGYSSASSSGIYSLTGVAGTQFYPVYLNVGNTTASNIDGNTITSISFTKTGAAAEFTGIHIESGAVNTGTTSGNTIGAASGTGAITVANNGTVALDVIGIRHLSSDAGDIRNNIIGSITTTSTTNWPGNIYGIFKSGGTGSVTISRNIIGNATTANSLNASSTSTLGSQSVYGISNTAASDITIAGNTIANMSNANTLVGGAIAGINFSGGVGTNNILKNFIYNLAVSSNNPSIYGIRTTTSSGTISNNIIDLGTGVTNGCKIFGIYEDGSATRNIYFNTVYVGGVAAGGANFTYALYNNGNTATRDYRNNIFYNARSGTGTHNSVRIAGIAGLTIGYNDYLGALIGLALNVAPDNNSLQIQPAPVFPIGTGTSLTDYVPSAPALTGTNISGITDDIDGDTRCIPTMGAQENISAPTLVTATATPNPICAGSTLTLTGNATGATSWSWSGPNLYSSSLQSPTIPGITSAGAGVYTLTATNCHGSASANTLAVVVNSAATVTPGGPDNVCQSASPLAITLTGASIGGGATTGAWSITSGGGTLSSTAQTATPAIVTYTPAANFTGTVTLTLTTNAPGACPAVSATRTINVNPAATVTPGGPDNVCQSATPSAITLTGASVGGGATTGAWSITSGGGILSSTSQTATPATVTYIPAANFTGTVTLTLTTNAPGACPAVNGTRTINVNPLPTTSAIWHM